MAYIYGAEQLAQSVKEKLHDVSAKIETSEQAKAAAELLVASTPTNTPARAQAEKILEAARVAESPEAVKLVAAEIRAAAGKGKTARDDSMMHRVSAFLHREYHGVPVYGWAGGAAALWYALKFLGKRR